MKLLGQICVEITAETYVEAAEAQQRLEQLLLLVKEQFPCATLAMRERRRARALPQAIAPYDHGAQPRPRIVAS